ncbi:MAG: hypothetical protein H7Y17_16230 [Chlorobia bacterium]|nr:hypothetical protein [Fimbriimonadaceae bacterium]
MGLLPEAGPQTYYFATSSLASCCLRGDVRVDTWDGRTKRADAVEVGDRLYGLDREGNPAAQTVEYLITAYEPCLRVTIGGKTFVCSTTHGFMGEDRKWIAARDLVPGETRLRGRTDEPVLVERVASLDFENVYSWSNSPDENFFSEGVMQATIPNKPGVSDA